MDRIGFIGLGRMGKPMASNLRKKQFAMVVHDVRQEPVLELESLGAERAQEPAEIARSADVIVTMLPSSTEVEAVVTEITAHGRKGQLVMDMSTIDPLATDRLAEQLAARGMRLVDAPVGRLATHADRGECLFMVGAADEDFARVKPMLEAMGTTIHHCGPVGSGIRTKLVNNFLAISYCQMNAEALALAQRFGLSLERTLEVLYGTTAINGQLKINWPDKVLRGDTAPGFTIDLAHKDLSLVLTAANAARVPMPMAAASREAFSAARAAGFGAKDFSAMVDALCELAGIEKPRFS